MTSHGSLCGVMVAEAYFAAGWRFVLQFKLSLSRMVLESIVSCPFKEHVPFRCMM